MEKIDIKELEKVYGGTDRESFRLIVELYAAGYGKFAYEGEDGYWHNDYPAAKEFFASKGFEFIPSDEEPNVFIDQYGIRYGQDYIENLMLNNQL